MRTKRSTAAVDMSTHPLTLAKNIGAARVYAASYHDPALAGQVIVSVDVGKVAERSHAAWENLRPTMELADGRLVALTCIRQTHQSGDRILCYATPQQTIDHATLASVRRIILTHRGRAYYASCA